MMMKKIGILAFALVFMASGAVLASPPVPPPVEVDTISTQTSIQCVGTVLETESYTRQWIGATDGDPGPEVVGAVPVDAGDVTWPPGATEAFPELLNRTLDWDDGPDGTGNPEIPIQDVDLVAPGSDVGGPGRDTVLGAGDTAGELRYEEEFNAIGGQIAYDKLFDTDTAGTPEDLDVDKTFTFVAVDPNGNLSFTEDVGMTIVSNGFDIADATGVTDVIGGLCPWVQDPGPNITTIPATNEAIAMGSEIQSAAAVQANTGANVGMSEQGTSPGMTYFVAAQGQGFIEAHMAAQIQEGFGPAGWGPDGAPRFVGDVAGMTWEEAEDEYQDPANWEIPASVRAPGLALFEQYTESSSANGQWTFSKSMAYESQIPVLQLPGVGPN
jgi:hypothetical protein